MGIGHLLNHRADNLDAGACGVGAMYCPSGRVAWVHFLPLAAVALIAAGLLAWFMGRLEWTAYMIVITPTVLCLPLLGALLLAIYAGAVATFWSRARSPL